MSNFDSFKAKFTGDLVTPNDVNYANAIARWAANAQRRAKVVAFVKTPEDIVLAIRYARENHLPIAIRGGGHSAPAASSSKDGLIIDLSKYFDGVRVDEKERLAYVGGGAIWETVDKEAIKFGLATVAGTVNHTGVGGLTLGGGYGWLTGRYGVALDNVLQATVVTADGSVLTTSKESHPDLFFGIRGAGCNFGVVTEFVFRLYPQRPTVYSGMLIYSPKALEQIVGVTQGWWSNASEDEAILLITTLTSDGNAVVVLIPFFNGSEEEGRAKFKKFLDIESCTDITRELPFEELNALQNPFAEHGECRYMKGIAQSGPHFPSVQAAHTRVIDVASQNNLQFHISILYEYFPLKKINSVPREETAFRRVTTPSILIGINWKPAPPDLVDGETENTAAARKIARELVDILQNREGKPEFGYPNFDPDAVVGEGPKDTVFDKARIAFGENYLRLQQVKKMYDPEGLFNKWFPIVPA